MKWIKRVGIILGVLTVIIVSTYLVLIVSSERLLARTYAIPEIEPIDIPTDAESIAEGRRLYITRACGSCHGMNGAGAVIIDTPVVGYIAGSNITRGEGGLEADYGTADYIRTIRHGVDPTGEPYVLMPSHDYQYMTDTDMGRMIAYIESLDPVDAHPGKIRLGPIGRILVMDTSAGLIAAEQIDHQSTAPWDIEPEISVRYGEYVSFTCTGCHGKNLSGGAIPGSSPGAPPAANLTPHESGLVGYTLEDFTIVLRNGIKPEGEIIDPQHMPWNAFALLTDTEIEALYTYLKHLEPLSYNSE